MALNSTALGLSIAEWGLLIVMEFSVVLFIASQSTARSLTLFLALRKVQDILSRAATVAATVLLQEFMSVRAMLIIMCSLLLHDNAILHLHTTGLDYHLFLCSNLACQLASFVHVSKLGYVLFSLPYNIEYLISFINIIVSCLKVLNSVLIYVKPLLRMQHFICFISWHH